jgi:hypothetical protein
MAQQSRTLAVVPWHAALVLVGAVLTIALLKIPLPPAVAFAPDSCPGDCSGDGTVTVDEILTLVNIALGNALVASCDSGDGNGDGQVTVDEILAAVNAALNGCASPPPTPTPEGGPPSVARRAAGTIAETRAAILAANALLSVLLNTSGFTGGAGAALELELPCPADGSAFVSCTQDLFPPPLGPPEYTVRLVKCEINDGTGTVTLDGRIFAVGREGDFCVVDKPDSLAVTIALLTVTAQDAQGTTTATFTDVSASVTLYGSDPDCDFNMVRVRLNGAVAVESTDTMGMTVTATQAMFDDTVLVIAVDQFGADCALERYTRTVNGDVRYSGESGNFTETYTDLVLGVDATSGDKLVDVSGGVTADCFGVALQFGTRAPLRIVGFEPCPRAGEVTVSFDNRTDLLRFTGDHGVEIDHDDNDSVDDRIDRCFDQRLFVCPGQ